MENTNSIFGVKPASITKKFNDEFEIVYDDSGRLQAESKKVFHHDDGELTFDYQYLVSIMDTDEYSGEKPRKFIYTLDLVPTFKSLCQQKKDSVDSFIGLDGEDANAVDVADYGMCVNFGVEEVSVDDNAEIDVDTDEKLDLIACVYEMMDSLRGFYLDKSWNRIGTTGWDTLESAIHGTDIFKRSIDAIKK